MTQYCSPIRIAKQQIHRSQKDAPSRPKRGTSRARCIGGASWKQFPRGYTVIFWFWKEAEGGAVAAQPESQILSTKRSSSGPNQMVQTGTLGRAKGQMGKRHTEFIATVVDLGYTCQQRKLEPQQTFIPLALGRGTLTPLFSLTTNPRPTCTIAPKLHTRRGRLG